MRYRFACLLVFICMLLFTSCKWGKEDRFSFKTEDMDDTTFTQIIEPNNLLYAIPSPHQVSLLIKEDCKFFDETILPKEIDINQYLTSERKALVLGALGADLGYLSLYEQNNTTLQYLKSVQHLIDISKFSTYNPENIFKQLKDNANNSDSLISKISEVYRLEINAVRYGERPQLGALVIAGGWIESFYLLNKIYDKTQNSNLFTILLQQQLVLENLIAILRPYYKKSNEFADLIDRLVEIAYEFEVVDVRYTNAAALNKDSLTIIKCRYIPVLTGSHLEKINELSGSLRNSLIF